MKLTREIAAKVRDTVDAGLISGIGVAEPGKMCVEAAVCYALGLPHGDDPGCVSPALRRLKIGLNDRAWSSPAARAQGLRRLAIAQLGSEGVLDDREFMRRVVAITIRKSVPAALRSAATVNPAHAVALEAAAVRCEAEGTRDSAREGERVARAAYATAADATAATAAHAAVHAAVHAADAHAADAHAAAYAAAYAAAAAAYAAYAAAAYAAYAADATADAARDRSLARYAEWVVEILNDMGAPGCQWLDLVPVEGGR
jgi:hypothetical protein